MREAFGILLLSAITCVSFVLPMMRGWRKDCTIERILELKNNTVIINEISVISCENEDLPLLIVLVELFICGFVFPNVWKRFIKKEKKDNGYLNNPTILLTLISMGISFTSHHLLSGRQAIAMLAVFSIPFGLVMSSFPHFLRILIAFSYTYVYCYAEGERRFDIMFSSGLLLMLNISSLAFTTDRL